jgi:hypothetical protein
VHLLGDSSCTAAAFADKSGAQRCGSFHTIELEYFDLQSAQSGSRQSQAGSNKSLTFFVPQAAVTGLCASGLMRNKERSEANCMHVHDVGFHLKVSNLEHPPRDVRRASSYVQTNDLLAFPAPIFSPWLKRKACSILDPSVALGRKCSAVATCLLGLNSLLVSVWAPSALLSNSGSSKQHFAALHNCNRASSQIDLARRQRFKIGPLGPLAALPHRCERGVNCCFFQVSCAAASLPL